MEINATFYYIQSNFNLVDYVEKLLKLLIPKIIEPKRGLKVGYMFLAKILFKRNPCNVQLAKSSRIPQSKWLLVRKSKADAHPGRQTQHVTHMCVYTHGQLRLVALYSGLLLSGTREFGFPAISEIISVSLGFPGNTGIGTQKCDPATTSML